jgi:hypothetical protein
MAMDAPDAELPLAGKPPLAGVRRRMQFRVALAAALAAPLAAGAAQAPPAAAGGAPSAADAPALPPAALLPAAAAAPPEAAHVSSPPHASPSHPIASLEDHAAAAAEEDEEEAAGEEDEDSDAPDAADLEEGEIVPPKPVLPRGVRMPRLPAAAAPGGADVAAALAELRRCGWVRPGFVEDAAAVRIAGWLHPAAACAGLRAFVARAASGAPPPAAWARAAVDACIRATRAAKRAAARGAPPLPLPPPAAAAPAHSRSRSRSASRASSSRSSSRSRSASRSRSSSSSSSSADGAEAGADAGTDEGANAARERSSSPVRRRGPRLPPGLFMPAFAVAPCAAGDEEDSLDAMLSELGRCGWLGRQLLCRSSVAQLRGWSNAAGAVAALRIFVARVAAEGTPPAQWAAAVDAARRAAARRVPDASITLPPDVRLPAWLTAAAHDGGADDVASMLDELQRCGWVAKGRVAHAVANRVARTFAPPVAARGLRAFVDAVLSRRLPAGAWGSELGNACATAQRAADKATADAAAAAAAAAAAPPPHTGARNSGDESSSESGELSASGSAGGRKRRRPALPADDAAPEEELQLLALPGVDG